MDFAADYNTRKQNYKEKLLKEIETHYKNGDLSEFIENNMGHTQRHSNQTIEDVVHRAEFEFKAGTTFSSDEMKNKVLYHTLKNKIDDIMEWKFGTTEKVLELNLRFQQPIGFGVNLYLQKFNISKMTAILSRDDINSDLGFYLKTAYPKLDKDSEKTNVTFKRKYAMPRLLPLYTYLDGNYRKFYKINMSKDGNRIKLESQMGKRTNYMIELPSDSIQPKFLQYDPFDGSAFKISPSEFRRIEPNIYSLVEKYYNNWKDLEPPRQSRKRTISDRDLNMIKDYCKKNNSDKLNDYVNLYNNGEQELLRLIRKDINPDVLFRKDLSEVMDLVVKQLKKNQYADSHYVDVDRYIEPDNIYNREQLELLFNTASLGISTALMENNNFTVQQMEVIALGLKHNHNNPHAQIDVEKYASTKIDNKKMFEMFSKQKNDAIYDYNLNHKDNCIRPDFNKKDDLDVAYR